MMQERLLELQEEALQKVAAASELKELNEVRVAYLGKKRANHGGIARHG